MKYAVISTDSNKEYYSLIPLACYSWNKLGYRPVVLTIGDVPDVIKYFCEADFIPLKQTQNVKDSTIAQLYRLFACQSPMFGDNDIIITSDSDMIIAKDIFNCNEGFTNYGHDLTGRSELPICYNIATAAKWRELMGPFTIPEKAYSEKWEDYWSVDQQLLTQRAGQYGMKKITFIDRGNNGPGGLPTGRWDRHGWVIPNDIIDVHMKRNSWEVQIEVFQKLWPGEDHSFITKFREALEGHDVTDQSKEVAVNLDGVTLRAPAVDTNSLDKLMKATSEIAEAYNYPAQLIESYGVELKAPVNINDIIEPGPLRIDIPDEFGFMKTSGNWDNHRPLLLLALSLTKGKVTECGAGEGSTPYLRAYCKAYSRPFSTYDNNEEWASKMKAGYVADWNSPPHWYDIWQPCALLFVDHAPGEHRKVAIERMIDQTDIIVVHDTEQGGAGDYGFEPVFSKFKYRLNYNKTGGGAGTTAVSNTIDLNQFRGLSLGKYTFDND